MPGRYARSQGCGCNARARTFDHLWRPVGGDDMETALCEFEGIDARTATQVEQASSSRKLAVHGIPQGEPHALDQLVIASRAVIVGRDTVEGTLRIEQLRLV